MIRRNLRETIAWSASGALALFVVAALTGVVSGGPLDPPGTPGPTMKTLQEVEPRTPVSATTTPGSATAVYVISQPGSYYLTGDVTGVSAKNGIEITASYVTLDLNGFALVGVPGSLDGINTAALREGFHIHSGLIRNWGGDGLDVFTTRVGHFDHLQARQNGGDGLKIGETSVLEDCESRVNTGDGIETDLDSIVRNCIADENQGNGINAASRNTVTDSFASANTLDGILLAGNSLVRGCSALSNFGDGIQAGSQNRIEDNTAVGNGVTDGAGIHTTNSANRISGNDVNGNDRGIDVDSSVSLIIGNSAHGNGAAGVADEYVIAASNTVGPIETGPVDPVASTNPWANFAY